MSNLLKKAKIQLVLSQPFFASLMLRLQHVEDTTIKTACTNGKVIRYNPAYFEEIGLDATKTVLAHEVMHVALLHHTRRAGRDVKKWNSATDYAINQILEDSKFDLPKGALINPAYRGKSAEEIYQLLPPEDDGDKDGDGDGNGMGGVEDAPAQTQSQKNEIEAETKQAVSQAAMAAKKAGKLPAGLERLIMETLQPQIAWQEVLARFLTEINRNDYTWKKPNRRYMTQGLYLPSLENEEAGKVALIVDTSASIDVAELNQFAAEMQSILNTFKCKMEVIYVDTEVAGVQEIEPDENVKLNPKGGGGTCFRPAFEHIEKQDEQPKAAVYFTDGECYSFPDAAPDYPVLWAQYGGTFEPPFGEVIKLRM